MKKDLPLDIWIKMILFAVVVILMEITPWSHNLVQAMTDPDDVDDFVLIAEMQPWRTGVWELAGRRALGEDDPLRAIQLLIHARNHDGLTNEGSLALGDAFYQAGDVRQAARVWQGLVDEERFTPQAHLRLVDLYQEHHEFEKAASILEEYYRTQTTQGSISAERVYQLGLLLAAVEPPAAPVYLNQAADMSEVYAVVSQGISREVIRASREDQPAYTYVTAGRVLGRFGYWDLAYYALNKAIELRPDYSEAWAYLAEAVRQTGRGSGYRQLRTALDLNSDSLAANTYMAVYWQREGNYERSIVFLQQAAQSDPSNIDLQVDLAAAIAASGDLDAALELYLQAVDQSEGTTAFPVGELIQFCVQYNVQVEELALPMARDAVSDFPGQAGPLDWHGLVLYTLGDMRNAERAFMRSLEQDPDYAPAHLHLGILYIMEGKSQLGRAHLRQAIEMTDDPHILIVAERHLDGSP